MAQYKISGTVVDDENEALIGATVVLQDLSIGTTTDENGAYELEIATKGELILVASYLGYENQEKSIVVAGNKRVDFQLQHASLMSDEIMVTSVRAGENTPTSFTNIEKAEITGKNLGQDVPYLLANQPSLVVNSDAGNGVGYTSMRIRGVKEINVTINGVPLNDAESHGVYWVDVPDIAGSTNSMQIQRGVGSSTNGSGAFGASINLNTDKVAQKAYTEYGISGGSFNTFKGTAAIGTGLIKDHWFAEGKFSVIKSDGYRDRASSDMKSYFAQVGYKDENTLIKLLAFGGREETYQAWYSVTPDEMEWYGRTFNPAGLINDADWGIAGYYDNFVDNFSQDHFQLHLAQEISDKFSFNAALHYTYGRGYYEEYMQEEMLQYYPMEFYNLDPLYFGKDSVSNGNGGYYYTFSDSITYSDVVRRLWLDNDFYGGTWGLKYQEKNLELHLGGALNIYADGQHFGEVIWARYASSSMPGTEFYRNVSNKTDFNQFAKATYSLGDDVLLYGDLQYRYIHYTAEGLDREWTDGDRVIDIDKTYNFFNPKAGLMYNINDKTRAYASYAVAHREPNRSDFLDAPGGVEPKPESLHDLELGVKSNGSSWNVELVAYNMMYSDQLVMTGELNGVGTPIRKNVGESYRRGLELIGGVKPNSFVEFTFNATLSDNKTSYKEYSETDGFVNYDGVPLSYSPSLIGNLGVFIYPIENFRLAWSTNYVGEQYVTNTSDEALKMDDYSASSLQFTYNLETEKAGDYEFNLWVNNVLNTEYSSKAVVHWSGGLGYFPQAGRNFLLGVNIRF